MALIGNQSVLHKSPGRFLAGTIASGDRSNFSKPGMLTARFETMDKLSAAIPGGHLSPSAWALPRTAGGASTVNMLNGAATTTASGALGVNGEAALSGDGGITSALLALVVSAVASLTGSGGLTADIVGKLEAAAALSGAGSLAGAAGALASLLASLAGAGSTAGVPRADGFASANIKGYGDLTPEGIRDAVWAALASSINVPGTAGAALLAAGSAGDPWGTPLPGAYAAGSAGALLGALLNGLTTEQATQLLEVFQRLGLDPAAPMTTSPTSITFGAESITIAEVGTDVTLTRAP
jgi:hypothetical protein